MHMGGPRRRVLLVAHWDWVLWHFRLPLAQALRASGEEVVLVCPSGSYTERLSQAGFRVVAWEVDRRGLNPLRETRAVLDLARLYRRERPHCVYHFTVKPNLYGTLAAWIAAVRVVINTFSGLGFLFGESRRAKLLRIAIVPLLRAIFRVRKPWTVVQNDEDEHTLLALGLARADRIRLIAGSGVDLERFRPADNKPNPPIVLMAARLLRDKGVADFVEVARRCKRRGILARFVLAGAPDPGNPATITASELEDWQRHGDVEFLGHREDLHEWLRQAEIAVLPTRYAEGVPRFLLEAAACGVPAVATDIAGCRAAVVDGVTGLLVPPRDVEALTHAVSTLIADEGRRRFMAVQARDVAKDTYGLGPVVEAYLATYYAAVGE